MNSQPLSEKEFEIINVIADGFRSSQRELSTHIGLSLGMTNLLLKRLAVKGYLRIKQLNATKVQYLLTPRGLAEKAQKSVHYTKKTIQSFGIIKEEIKRLLMSNLNGKIKDICVVGEGDLADLVSMILRELISEGQFSVKRMPRPPENGLPESLIIIASQEPTFAPAGTDHQIDVMASLSQNLSFRNAELTTQPGLR